MTGRSRPLSHTCAIIYCRNRNGQNCAHGGISVSQAFLPPSPSRNDLVKITDAVVMFSTSVQRLTINRVLEGSVRSATGIHRGHIDRVHDSAFPIWYSDSMSSMKSRDVCFLSGVRGVACLVMLLCVCVVVQMLGVPATFMDLLSSDVLVKVEPVSEDHSVVSFSAEVERPTLLTFVTESHRMLRLPILTASVFHPPSL